MSDPFASLSVTKRTGAAAVAVMRLGARGETPRHPTGSPW